MSYDLLQCHIIKNDDEDKKKLKSQLIENPNINFINKMTKKSFKIKQKDKDAFKHNIYYKV